ncbi:peptide chain release factor N(5)-glutamine methyltransferase [Oceanirhabdus seepicola]|uniref:Release factor glutamine methyltransferase n=1 Tax=Oceanirhabdus seepicola TaxID=2828781 RepID=A0A9J6P1K0_9CLOT|nr:peptide chain release factor N(5)-glutamine methyltransferase [Oceanirhabdus seepicola]MCM1990062.1 peptide chain release factor N(5)-glutamine methyltransferase [Oceanirhabdus seepicola]
MNISEALKEAYEILKENNMDTYMLDTQVLLAHVLKKDRLFLTLNREVELDESTKDVFFNYIEERRKMKPIKYITKECEFMGLDFYVEEGVLIPRPDTEILVEEVLERINSSGYTQVCDVCCGSGAIGLSLAHHGDIKSVELVDISNVALKVSRINTEKLGLGKMVTITEGDLLNDFLDSEMKFDCIVSNPPYIESGVIDELMSDVKDYEPHLALDGGEDGLVFYRKITSQSKEILRDGGMLAFEIGYNQKESVSRILIQNGFKNIETFKDLGDNDRVVIGYL